MDLIVPKPKKGALGAPPAINDPKPTNLTKKPSSEFSWLTLRLPVEFKRELKLYATQKDCSMVDVIMRAVEEYKKRNR